MTREPLPVPPAERVALALDELPRSAPAIAERLAALGCIGNRHDGRVDALAMFLRARAGVPVHVHARTVTVYAVPARADVEPREVAELVLPEHVALFVRWLGGGWYPALLGAPSSGTAGPLSTTRRRR